MKKKSLWILHIPLLSLAHMPGPLALTALRSQGGIQVAEYPDGGFVPLPPAELCIGQLAWLLPIVEWAATQLFNWVCFDRIGADIDSLPQYTWE